MSIKNCLAIYTFFHCIDMCELYCNVSLLCDSLGHLKLQTPAYIDGTVTCFCFHFGNFVHVVSNYVCRNDFSHFPHSNGLFRCLLTLPSKCFLRNVLL